MEGSKIVAAGSFDPEEDEQLPASEARCHTCQHPNRRRIDQLLSVNTPFAEIERIFGIPARGLSRHKRLHLNYEDAAVAQLVNREIEIAKEDSEVAIAGALQGRVYLQVAVRKALDALTSDRVTVEPKDAVKIIELLERLNSDTSETTAQIYEKQFNALVSAVRELVPPDLWEQIKVRSREHYTGKIEISAPAES